MICQAVELPGGGECPYQVVQRRPGAGDSPSQEGPPTSWKVGRHRLRVRWRHDDWWLRKDDLFRIGLFHDSRAAHQSCGRLCIADLMGEEETHLCATTLREFLTQTTTANTRSAIQQDMLDALIINDMAFLECDCESVVVKREDSPPPPTSQLKRKFSHDDSFAQSKRKRVPPAPPSSPVSPPVVKATQSDDTSSDFKRELLLLLEPIVDLAPKLADVPNPVKVEQQQQCQSSVKVELKGEVDRVILPPKHEVSQLQPQPKLPTTRISPPFSHPIQFTPKTFQSLEFGSSFVVLLNDKSKLG